MKNTVLVEAEKEGFYIAIAELLQCTGHRYHTFPYSKRTRWNNRAAGNGRYEGHGLVRWFSPDHIHIQMYQPVLSGLFNNPDSALAAIQHAVRQATPGSSPLAPIPDH